MAFPPRDKSTTNPPKGKILQDFETACVAPWIVYPMNGGAAVDVIVKRFDNPDEVRSFTMGRFEIVHIAGMTPSAATYEPDGSGPSTSDGARPEEL